MVASDSPGVYTAFSPLVTGSIYDNAAPVVPTAYSDMVNAFNLGASQYPNENTDAYPVTLGGQAFTKGVYRWSSTVSMAASTTLTLSGALGDVIILQMP